MGERPLRQHYLPDVVHIEVDPTLADVATPWRRHRRRFLGALGDLDEAQWAQPSRCDGWTVRDVVSHLVSADGFWVASLGGVGAGVPTSYLAGFDPTTVPAAIVAGTQAEPPAAVLEQFAASTEAFEAAVAALDDDAWLRLGESPIGHVPAPLVLAHAHWDSWVHERDVFVPLGSPPAAEPDEAAAAAWYTLLAGAIEGGLPGDPDPVGPGLGGPLDATVAFDDPDGLALRIRIDRDGVVLRPAESAGTRAGATTDFVDHFTGRDAPAPAGLDPALADHLGRAFRIL